MPQPHAPSSQPDSLPPLHDNDQLQEEQDAFDAEVARIPREERVRRILAMMDGAKPQDDPAPAAL
jgi:hypothetical protein